MYGTRQTRLWLASVLALCLLLGSCGFRLKGSTPLPFTTLYTNIDDNTLFGSRLRRAIQASSPQLRFAAQASDAQARLIQLGYQQSLREIGLDPAGHVEDYELIAVFDFQVTDQAGHMLLAPTRLRSVRELPYDPDAAQAKEQEIQSVFEDMQLNLIDRILHRLTSPELQQAWEKASANPPVQTR